MWISKSKYEQNIKEALKEGKEGGYGVTAVNKVIGILADKAGINLYEYDTGNYYFGYHSDKSYDLERLLGDLSLINLKKHQATAVKAAKERLYGSKEEE